MYSQKIVPHLWFDTQAKEAAEFYVSAFGGDSKILSSSALNDAPSGAVAFSLRGFEFMAFSAGPMFKFTPAISFMLNFDPSRDPDALNHLNEMWEKLSEGGKVLMEIQEYPFSKRYGWLEDKFGVTWQLILTDPEGEERPFIIPSLMFVQEVAGKAEEAINFYASVFKDSKVGMIARYPAGSEPDKEGSVMFADFQIEGQWFAANDSAQDHKYNFTEAISLMVVCKDQDEVDYYWEKLSAVPEAEQCGWLKDKYGVSWQIAPEEFNEMMSSGTPEQVARVTECFLEMKKLDLEKLRAAYNGE